MGFLGHSHSNSTTSKFMKIGLLLVAAGNREVCGLVVTQAPGLDLVSTGHQSSELAATGNLTKELY